MLLPRYLHSLNHSGGLFHIGRIAYFAKWEFFRGKSVASSTNGREAGNKDYFSIPGNAEISITC